MKNSIFNSYFEITDQCGIIYNSFSNKYIITTRANIKTMRDENYENLPGNLYKDLVESSMLVDNEKDEGTDLQKKRCLQYADPTQYYITINPTLNCNLSCWYCYETKVPGRMSDALLEGLKKYLTNKLSDAELKFIRCYFFGGEPLMYFKRICSPIMKVVYEKCIQNNIEYLFDFTTNSVLLTDEMIKELEFYKNVTFQITLDGNREAHNATRYSHNKQGTYDIIICNMRKILHSGFKLNVRFNVTMDNIDGVRDVIKDIIDFREYKKTCCISFERVWQDFEKGDIRKKSQEVEKLFQDNGFIIDVVAHIEEPKWCYANRKNSAIINYDGYVYKCSARDFIHENSEGRLKEDGSIEWNVDQVKRRKWLISENKACYTCRIGPICTERCSQKLMENGLNVCPFSEERKDEMILNRLHYYLFQKA